MFADSGAPLPPGIRTVTPEAVAAAIVRAIERNRAEVDAAPLALRAGARLAGVAPVLARIAAASALGASHRARGGAGSRRAAIGPCSPGCRDAPARRRAAARQPSAGASPPTILAGAAISLQSYVNGRVGKDVARATIAAAINNGGRVPRDARDRAGDRRAPACARSPAGARAGAGLALPRRVRRRRARAGLGHGGAGGRRRAADGRARLRVDGRSLPVDAAGLGPAGGGRSRSRASPACCSPCRRRRSARSGRAATRTCCCWDSRWPPASGMSLRRPRTGSSRARPGSRGRHRSSTSRSGSPRSARSPSSPSRRPRSTTCRATRCSSPAACSARSWSSSAPPRWRPSACCGSGSRWSPARWRGRWSST